jgi:hypothetical protein
LAFVFHASQFHWYVPMCECACVIFNFDTSKTKVIYFSRKRNTLIYEYKVCQSSITSTRSIKGMVIFLDSELLFHNHVNSILSQCNKLVGLLCSIALAFSSLGSLSVCLSVCLSVSLSLSLSVYIIYCFLT